jgi:hypothetical protein
MQPNQQEEWVWIKEDRWHQTWLHKEHGERQINTELLNFILQKALKEDRERIATELDRYAHESHSATINIKHLMNILVPDQSELDQAPELSEPPTRELLD